MTIFNVSAPEIPGTKVHSGYKIDFSGCEDFSGVDLSLIELQGVINLIDRLGEDDINLTPSAN